ncbi:MAG: hypothetical protein JO108_26005 [Acidobacteriaceae bacterium]|nr:hypothetical protein [Acidobacteriaceae bacterium]
MDRSQYTYTPLDDLRQIQREARQSHSLDELRDYYERVQSIRRTHSADFDLQLFIAEVQEEVIERGRTIREEQSNTSAGNGRRRSAAPKPEPAVITEPGDSAEIGSNAQHLDTKTWQRATYLALFFTLIICAAFFYLIQTARKINLPQTETATAKSQTPSQTASPKPAQPEAANQPRSPAPTAPTLRLYTDLIPGTLSLDAGEPQDLKDGELTLDNLQPGRHSIRVSGRNGTAEFSFEVSEKAAPRVVGLPTASNAMAVLVSSQNGEARLVTNLDHPTILLDGNNTGDVGTDGLQLTNLGTTDHDIQVAQNKDRQRFVLTYAPTPALTVYVKSDPNAGTAVIMTGEDGVDVYINDKLWRRKTDRGQLRIPLKVGSYTVRVHKDGFIDPPPETIDIKKSEESAIEFKLQPVPAIATLQIKGALPGTIVYVDKDVAASIGADGNATIPNVKPGDHTIELRRDQALPKRFVRTFRIGETISLSGPDVTLDKVIVPETKPPPEPPAAAPDSHSQPNSMEIEGQRVQKGGGFVPYHVPKTSGRYTFSAQARKSGLFKHPKVQWFAAYEDPDNYVLFTADGKHASVREVRDGKSTDLSRVPFNFDNNEWVQVDLTVRQNVINARVKTQNSAWADLGPISSEGRDFTKGKVGFYIPGNDEVAVANFRFAGH